MKTKPVALAAWFVLISGALIFTSAAFAETFADDAWPEPIDHWGTLFTVPRLALTIRNVLCTGYCPCTKCTEKTGPWEKRTTKFGEPAVVPDGIAAAPGSLPEFGEVYVPDVGSRKVDDIGGALITSAKRGVTHIDVRFRTHQEALEYARNHRDIVLYLD